LHPSRDARRACPRGPVARLSKDGMWSPPQRYLTADVRCVPNAKLKARCLGHRAFSFGGTRRVLVCGGGLHLGNCMLDGDCL